MKKQELTKKKMLGYCVGDIFGGGAFTLVGMLYMNYLTDDIALSATLVGVMLFIGKIWDSIIDPFIGNISEKTSSKMGKRRVFFFAGIFHIGAAFIALWVPFYSGPVWLKAIYFTLAYMLFATSFSLTMVPYHAMLSELTDDNKKRNKTASLRSIISNCSSMIAGLVPSILVGQIGYLGMGIAFAIFYTIPWIIVFVSTKGLDVVNAPEKEENKVNIFKSFIQNAKTVLSNRSFRKMLGLYLLSYTAMDIFMAIFVYYVKWYMLIWGLPDQKILIGAFTDLLGVFMVFEVLSIPVYTKIAEKKGKRFAFLCSTAMWAFSTIVLFFMAAPDRSIFMLAIPAGLMGAGAGGVAYLPWAMLPETMDVEELISGERKDGIYSGFLTFIRQLSQALALLIVGIYLGEIDNYSISGIFESLNTQFPDQFGSITDGVFKALKMEDLSNASEAASNYWRLRQVYANVDPAMGYGIKIFTSFAPCILLIGAFIVAISYPINNKNYVLIQNEIKYRNTTNKEDIAELEKITGKKYSELSKKKRKE